MMHNEERKCVSIVETSKGNTPEINLNLLEKILKNYQDHPVAIISVFGEHRTGKSFLLNNLCQYLLSNQSPYWYQENDRSLAKLFHWRAGTKPDTNGIHITDQPFMLKNNKGKNIAVFLMDTQGSFDKAINAKQCSIIFAWSTLLSSLQIYNLPGLIRENDLQHLGIFCHTQTLLENNKEEIPCRREPRIQNLMILVRNWQTEGYPLGSEGGMKYWEEVLEAEEEENKDIRKKIIHSFNEISCHLLPHPGRKVTRITDSNDSNLKLSDIDVNFLEAVDDLAKNLFSKEKSLVKQINGENCTGQTLMNFAKNFNQTIKSGKHPTIHTALKSMEIVEFKHKVDQLESEYKTSMETMFGEEFIDPTILKKSHDACLERAKKEYKEHDVLDEKESLVSWKRMVEHLDFVYENMKTRNNARKDKLPKFYRKIEKDYEAIMKTASEHANGLMMDRVHNKFIKDVIKQLEQAIDCTKCRQKAIDTFTEMCNRARLKLPETGNSLRDATIVCVSSVFGLAVGLVVAPFAVGPALSLEAALGVFSAVGLGGGGVLSSFRVLIKNSRAYKKVNILTLPSIIYLNSIDIQQPCSLHQ